VFERLQSVYSKGVAYGYHLGQRPQSLYGIADSPVGLAAYFLDHDALSYALISRVFAGEAAGLTRDDVLDNITLTITTSSRKVGTSLPGNSRSSCPRICAWASGRSVIDRGRAERARETGRRFRTSSLPRGRTFEWEEPDGVQNSTRTPNWTCRSRVSSFPAALTV
jgi:hypothetical protein